MDQIRELQPLTDANDKLPFVGTTLSTLRQEVGSESTVLGFIGAPWTLAAYSVEGKADKYISSQIASKCTLIWFSGQFGGAVADYNEVSSTVLHYLNFFHRLTFKGDKV